MYTLPSGKFDCLVEILQDPGIAVKNTPDLIIWVLICSCLFLSSNSLL